MFLRFVSTSFDEDTQVRLGIFQAAYEPRNSGRLHSNLGLERFALELPRPSFRFSAREVSR